MTDIVKYLESKGVELREAPNLNVRTQCFFHGEEGEAHTGRLYIKVDPDAETPGLFFCHVCEEKGTLNRIKAHFGDPVGEEELSRGRRIQILNAAAEYYASQIDKDTLSYLMGEKRGLTVETVERFRLGTATGDLADYLLRKEFPLDEIKATGLVYDSGEDFFGPGIVTIPYFDQGECVQIRGRDREAEKNKYKTPHGQTAVLYNTDTLLEGDEVILTEGEFDAMVLEDRGFSAIGIPGSRAFKEEWLKFFQGARRIYIGFDGDDSGRGAADKLAATIGAKARIINMPDETDVTEFLVEQERPAEDFQLLMRKANPGILVRVEDAFESWLDREGNPNLTGLKTGYEKLDHVFHPGLLRGQLMVFLARTGTGKTIMMINFMQRMIMLKPDIKILFISLEQTRSEWFERARRIHGFYNTHLDPSVDLNQETINYYRNNLLIVDKNRLSEEDLVTCIRQSEDEIGAKLDMAIVDYLGYYARSFRGEPYVRVSDAVMSLKGVGKEEDLIIMAPAQVNRGSQPGTKIKTNDARESGVIEETADLLMSLNNADKDPTKTAGTATGEIVMQVLKSRHGGDLTEIEMLFAPTSLAMVPQVDDLFDSSFYRAARDEVNWRKNGEFIYEDILERHRTGNRTL